MTKLTADTITDGQIREMWKRGDNAINGATLMDALGEAWGPCMRIPTDAERLAARARCAEILNARATHWPDCALNHGGADCDMGPECGS